jgi:hypothetical protein
MIAKQARLHGLRTPIQRGSLTIFLMPQRR